MIDGLGPYPEYRESGLPWAPRVPGHWGVRRLKAVLKEVDRRSLSGRERLLSLRATAGLVDHHASGGRHIPSASLVGYKHVLPGEIVMNRMRAATGLFAAAREAGLVSPDYAVFQPAAAVLPQFAVHLFRTPLMGSVFRVESRGLGTGESGFLRLYSDRFGAVSACLPPPDEQAAIVRFLDHANRRIDGFIRAKRKLIALLNEQKQAIIHRAVTRGLDPSVPMKDSGVPWIGEIPAHWEVRRLKRLITHMEQGWSPQCDAQAAVEGEWGVLKVGCVNGEAFDQAQNKRLPPSLAPRETLQVMDGDVVMSRANTPALVGLAALVHSPRPKLLLSDKLFRLRFQTSVSPEFLVHVIRDRSTRSQIQSRVNGASSSMQNIAGDTIRCLVAVVPSFFEQIAICEFIRAETSTLTKTLTHTTHELALLREYRTRLISDVVTGQLDVRAAAAGLPAEAPEPEPETADDLDADLAEDEDASDEEIDGDDP